MINEIKKNFIKISTADLTELELMFNNVGTDNSFNSIVEKSFFLFHSIKGTAPMLGYSIVGNFAGKVENFFRIIKENKIAQTSEIIDVSIKSIIIIRSLIISDASPSDVEIEEIKNIELFVEKFC